MHQHLDLLAAQSIAHERERELQHGLRQREADRRRPLLERPAVADGHHWLHDALVHVHLLHTPSH